VTKMRVSSSATERHPNNLDRFLEGIARALASVLLLDYDGTLAPFSNDRRKASPYLGIVPLLQQIMACEGSRVVIITGRSAPEVVSLLGMDQPPEVWGAHGLQRLRPNGVCEIPPLGQQALHLLSQAKQWLVEQGLDNLAEYKPGGIAVHWRALPDASVEMVQERVLQGWEPLAQSKVVSLLDFDGGVEIRIAGTDKGTAVRVIVNETEADVPIAYLGDDATDEAAFEALGDRGLSILVRPEWRNTSAQLWLKPPEELLDFLERWRKACESPLPSPSWTSQPRSHP
jgi:trehalose 6-phosphate phosphatase